MCSGSLSRSYLNSFVTEIWVIEKYDIFRGEIYQVLLSLSLASTFPMKPTEQFHIEVARFKILSLPWFDDYVNL